MYSFGCVAYEMLTRETLFQAPNEVAQISMHVAHDGRPEPLGRLLSHPEIGPIAEILVTTLRRDPRKRPSAEEVRRQLRAVASMAKGAAWPVKVA
jgi:serine/threonine protein kinase